MFMQPRRRERGLAGAAARARDPRSIAHMLAWFGIGLGLAELSMPRAFGRVVGVRKPNKAWVRAFGLREIASGVGILARRDPAPFLWARVAGDAMDLAVLAAGARTKKARSERLAAAAIAVAGVAVLDVVASRAHGAAARARGVGALRMHESIAINRPIDELFAFWRDLANLPSIMSHVQSVQSTGERHSRWRATSGRSPMEWDTELLIEAANEKIQWRSVEGSKVSSAGLVVFQALPGGRGTLIKLDLEYVPQHARSARNLLRLFGGAPQRQLRQDLRRFKQRIEAGEVATTQGQPSGRRSLLSRHLP
jgi:uncharacterized membrane protein